VKNAWKWLVPVVALGLGACDGPGGGSDGTVLARAGGAELTARATAEILAPQPQLPAQPEVVRALADLWVQYVLLARSAAEDSTLANLDLTPLVQRQVDGELLSQLRDRVIQVDTVITDEELQARYEEELPGGSVRARHILLQFPEGASQVQEDSVRALAESLRTRIVEGEDFEELAREYSQDAGTAGQGGDLGSFGKGQMVPPFEDAAFRLAEGEISPVVETPFGLHIIRVDERVVPPLEERRDQFRSQLQNRRAMEAESTYVADVAEGAGLEVIPEGYEAIKQLASDPGTDLSSRALNRPLVRYTGGAYTLGEFREWLLLSPQDLSQQIQSASEDQLENLVTGLTRSELLVNEARSEGLDVPQARVDSIAESLITGVRGIARTLGFFELTPEEGETIRDAADRRVRQIITEVVQEGRNVYPLQTVAFALKEQYGARISQAGIDRTVALVQEIRSQPKEASSGAPAEEVEDTSGGGTAAPDSSEGQTAPGSGEEESVPDTAGAEG